MGWLLGILHISRGKSTNIQKAIHEAGGFRLFSLKEETIKAAGEAAAEHLFGGAVKATTHCAMLVASRSMIAELQADTRLQLDASAITAPARPADVAAPPRRRRPPPARPRPRRRSPRGSPEVEGPAAGGEGGEDSDEGADHQAGGGGAPVPREYFLDGHMSLDELMFSERDGKGQLEAVGMLKLILHPGSAREGVPEEVPFIVERLQSYVATRTYVKNGDDQSSAFLASSFPSIFKSILLEEDLRSGLLSYEMLKAEMRDGIALRSGQAQDVKDVESQRVFYLMGDRTPTLSQLLAGLTPTDAHSQIERLSALYLAGRAQQSLRFRILDLESKLLPHRRMVQQAKEGGASVSETIRRLTTEQDAVDGRSGFQDSHSSSAAERLGSLSLSPKALQKEAIIQAHNEQGFLEYVSGAAGRNFDGQEIQEWERAIASGSTILSRYFMTLDRDSSLEGTHEIYGRLKLIESARIDMIAHFQMTEDDGSIPVPEMQAHRWDQSSFKKLQLRLYHEIDWVNAPSGVLGLLNLKDINGYTAVPKDQLWSVPSVIDIVRPFIHRTFTSIGYAHFSDEGYTIATLLDLHKRNVEWCRDLGGSVGPAQLQYAVECFVDELKVIGSRALALQAAVNPAGVHYTHVAPYGCEYERKMKLRRSHVEPIRMLQRAVPEILPACAPKVLEGVKLGGSATKSKPQGKGHSGGATSRAPSAASGKRPPSTNPAAPDRAPDTPGSKAFLAKALASNGGNDLMLGGRVYDLIKISGKFGMRPADKCWPVLLSSKPGNAKLALCPCAGDAAHATLGAPAHTSPAGWSVDDITNSFSRLATSAERSNAGTAPASASSASGSSLLAGTSVASARKQRRRRP